MPVLAVPAATVVIIGLIAILLLLGWELFTKAVTHVVPAWHIPGLGSLRGWIESHLHDGLNALAGYFDTYVHGLTATILAPVVLLRTFLTGITKGLGATHLLFWAILNHTIPVAKSELRKFAVSLVAGIEAKALNWYHSSLKFASDLGSYVLTAALTRIAFVEAQALSWYHTGLHYAEDLASFVLHAALAEVAAARAEALNFYHLSLHYAQDLAGYVQSQAVGLFHTAMVTIETRYQQALAFAAGAAKAEATAVLHGLNGALITDIEHAWPIVIAGIDDVIDAAAGEFTDIVDDLKGISRSLPRDLPAAIAATTAIAIPLLRLAKDCTMPNCRNLSQVGRDLQALFTVIESGALIAVLAEAASNPAGLADIIRSTLGPLVDTAVSATKSEVGVN